MATMSSSSLSTDQAKYLVSKLLARSMLKLVAASLCDKVPQEKGTGLTAYFVRYARMNVPLVALTEGVDPAASVFTLEQVTVTLDQWGDIIELTDVAQLTTKHPVLQQAIELLADNAQRVIDREIQIVWMAGTNVMYGNGSVTTRRTITAAMTMSDTIAATARVTLVNAGAPPRGGPDSDFQLGNASKASSINMGLKYVAVCSANVTADIMTAGTSLGTFASVAMYANQKALYNSEVGEWQGIRWVESNFIPRFSMLGSTTAAVASGAAQTVLPVITASATGGTLTATTTYFWKVTRKDLKRGFEEAISVAHSTASAGGVLLNSFSFAFPATAGYVYNLYFDSVQAGGTGTDATLGLVSANIAAGATIIVTGVAGLTTTPPDNVNTTLTPTIHPVYIHAEASCGWVGLQDLKTYITKEESTIGNVLQLKRALGYKYLAKSLIKDQTRLLRVEVAATISA